MATSRQGEELERILRESTKDPAVISFAGGFPATETFPREALVDAAREVLSESGVATSLQYAWPEGERGLREWVSERLSARGAAISPEEVIITSGAQDALSLAVSALRSEKSIHVEPLCYPGALELFRAHGLRLTSELEGANAAYVMPGVSNPSGHGLTRAELDAILARGVPMLVDEAYAELRFDRALPLDVRSAAPERTYLVGGISKSVCPGLRIGWIVAPAGARELLLENKRLGDLQAGTLVQALFMHWLSHHDYDAHVRRAVRLYRARAHALQRHLAELLPTWSIARPQGGFCVVTDTGVVADEVSMLRAAREEGVVYDPGSGFRARPDPRDTLLLRLCYSNLDTQRIAEGVRRLGRAYRRCITRS